MSIRSACSVVTATAKQPEFEVTDEVRRKLADFMLACRVRLAFAIQPASRGVDLSVKAENGVVTVTGDVPQAARLASTSTRLEHELRTIAAGVEGVQGVELGVRPFDPRG